MIFLKQSTIVIIRVGSFVAPADAVTPTAAVALAACDQAEVLKAGGVATVDISGNTWAAIAGCVGWYNLTLTVANTNTLGELKVVIQDADVCLPVWVNAMVMPTNVWDSLYGADNLQIDLIQVNGVAQVIADFQADVTLDAKEAQATINTNAILAALPAAGQPDFNVSGE